MRSIKSSLSRIILTAISVLYIGLEYMSRQPVSVDLGLGSRRHNFLADSTWL